jgi:hypothetical protein
MWDAVIAEDLMSSESDRLSWLPGEYCNIVFQPELTVTGMLFDATSDDEQSYCVYYRRVSFSCDSWTVQNIMAGRKGSTTSGKEETNV